MSRLSDLFDEFDSGLPVAEPPVQAPQPGRLGDLFTAFDTGEPAPVDLLPPVEFEQPDFGGGIADPSDLAIDPIKPETTKSGFFKTIEKELAPLELTKKIPIVGAAFGLIESAGTIGAAKRLQLGDYEQFKPGIIKAEERFTETLRSQGFDVKQKSPEELEALGLPGFHTKENDETIIGEAFKKANEEFTFGGKVAKGLTTLPTWMLEFAATGGLAQLGDKAARKAGEKLLGRYVTTKAGKAALATAGLTAGAVVRSSTGLLPRVVEKATTRQALVEIGLKGGEGWATSFAKAWGDTVIESFSEETGGIITKGLGAGVKKLPFGGKFINALRSTWVKSTGGTADDFAKRMLTKAGYSNIIGEIGEERVGTILREATGVSDREGNIQTRIWEGIKEDFTPENLGVEAIVLAVPALAGKALSVAAAPPKPTAPVTEAEAGRITPKEEVTPKVQIEKKTAQIDAQDAKALDIGQKLANQTGKTIFVQEGKVLTSKPEGDSTEIKPVVAEKEAGKVDLSGTKVVDESRKPLTVFHGTKSQFTAFDPEALGSNTKAKTASLGFFFTEDKFVAKRFAGGEESGVKEVQLNITNPVDLFETPLKTRKTALGSIVPQKAEFTGHNLLTAKGEVVDVGEMQKIGDAHEQLKRAVANRIGKEVKDLTVQDYKDWKDFAISKGFDGIRLKNAFVDADGRTHTVWIAFENAQIVQPPPTAEKEAIPPTKKQEKPLIVDRETKQAQKKVVPEESVTVETAKAVEDAVQVDVTDPAFPTSTKHDSTKEIRERLGIGQVNSKTRRSDEEAMSEAVKRKIPENAKRIADEINAEPRALSDIEDAGMRIKVAELEIEHEQLSDLIGKATDDADIRTLGAEITRVRAEFDSLQSALETSGTEAGRALRARKVQISRDFSLIAVLNQAKAAAGKKLKATSERLFKQLTDKLKKTTNRVEALETEVAELQAKGIVKRGARRFTIMTTQQRKASRSTLANKLNQLLEEGCAN